MTEQNRKLESDRQVKQENQNDLEDDDFFDDWGEEEGNYPESEDKEKKSKGPKSSPFQGIKGLGANLGKVKFPLGKNMAGEMTKLSQKVSSSAAEIKQGVAKSAKDLGQGTIERSKEVAKSATEVAQGVTKSAIEQGKAVKQEATQFIGKKLQTNQESISKKLEENQIAKEASVKAYLKEIDLNEVEEIADEICDKYPSETPEKLSQRLIRQQVVRVSKNSVVTTVIPGKIAETVGIDYMAIALMEAEIIFQIAAVYGFDPRLAIRRKEAYAIIDRVRRSTRSGRIATSVTQTIPIARGIFFIGTDAVLVYLVGDTARQFYRYLTEETIPGDTLAEFIEETDRRYPQRLW